MRLTGTPDELNRVLRGRFPDAPEPPMNGAQMLSYQMLALYGLARPFDCAAMSILEIGTGHGTSTYMLSKATPAAQVVSLSLNKHEAAGAYRFLRLFQCGNVYVLVTRSDRYRLTYTDVLWDMVFVDGDHKHIIGDMPWWNQVRPGGTLEVKLPHWQSDVSYRDPTHYWQFSPYALHMFDPETEYGREYAFYTTRKWKLVKGPLMNHAGSSIHCILQVVK